MFEIRVHGLGGQGAVTLVTWVAQAGYAMDKHVQAFPFFGAERRGAPVKAYVRIDEEPINLRSQIYHPDLLLVMSRELTGAALEEGIAPDGRLLVNAERELAEKIAARFSRDVDFIDATGIALDSGLEYDGMPMVNIPLFGTLVSEAGVAPVEVVLELVSEIAKRGNLEAYESAATRGFNGVQRAVAKEKIK
ncbi:MAG: 2-oxoacid:acceptor oxidoreductase family protein [Actinobacteria bacterium]|nr:2-oxoacid:acceptor oxidoreductase family protein [Actinomycetota bacterium]